MVVNKMEFLSERDIETTAIGRGVSIYLSKAVSVLLSAIALGAQNVKTIECDAIIFNLDGTLVDSEVCIEKT